MSLSRLSEWQVQFAAKLINSGGVVAHPTEAVWGLACHPGHENAVYKVLSLKNRPVEKGLILVAGDASYFEPLLKPLPLELKQRFLAPLSRPTTWLVPDEANCVPRYIKGKFSTVALRISHHPLVVELSHRTGSPLVSTSANPAGKPPAMSLNETRDYFRGRVDFLLRGRLGGYEKPSEIRDLVSGQVIRT